MKKETIKISGMTCVSCSNRVEKNLLKLKGVKSASVNYATEKATITYNLKEVTLGDIHKNIENTGYKIIDDDNKTKKIKNMWQKFIISAIFTIPLFLISMLPMIGVKIPTIIDDNLNPLNFALVQLFLTIPIIIVGYRFYLNGFKAVINKSPNMDTLIATGTSAAFIYSLYNTILISQGNLELAHSLFYETTGVIITLMLLGKTLEAIAKGKTSEAIKN